MFYALIMMGLNKKFINSSYFWGYMKDKLYAEYKFIILLYYIENNHQTK